MALDYFPKRNTVAEDFRLARRRADMQSIVSRLSGKSAELLSYEQVRTRLRARETSSRFLQDIPLAAIIGSVGRYDDFTRDFLPRKAVAADRWIRVKLAMVGPSGVPPIEVYRIDEVYFVLDGNHRVSVAREMGLTHLEGYVTEVATRVPLQPDAQPDDLIFQAEYIDFVERTQQDELRPEADLRLTASGRYSILLEHIEVHRYYLGLECSCEISHARAFTSWYDTVYLPVVEVVRNRGLLRDFPNRTETDLYLWISQHRAELEQALDWDVSTDRAALNLQPKQAAARRFRPARERLMKVLTTASEQDSVSTVVESHADHAPRRPGRVIDDLLVAIDGGDTGWNALEQALVMATRENARVHGLHVLRSEVNRAGARLIEIERQFEQRCQAAGISGRMAVAVGNVVETLCQRSRWVDLVVVGRAPAVRGAAGPQLASGYRSLIRECPRPVLIVPGVCRQPRRVLLAYDGGRKSEHALYAATYLAGWWSLGLTVLTVSDSRSKASKIQASVRDYLARNRIEAEMSFGKGPVGSRILDEANAHGSDIILMGGYGHGSLVGAMLGSPVDHVLRSSEQPVFVFT